ncbi:hypothetical protein [uncultured Roseibium sp.]|uniref:hypothetical protein n=1 Tax=uncultured Roseibium sp. TaxID=1936171 RepID=UPI00262BA20D|nr:hypothetical protein [uncultured Roseibium sp.]
MAFGTAFLVGDGFSQEVEDTPIGEVGENGDDEPIKFPENTLPDWLYFSELDVKCEITTPMGASYLGTQTSGAGGEKKLIKATLQNCRYEIDEDGSGQLVADLELDLVDTANLDACNALSLAFLFEVVSLSPDFAWDGRRTLVESMEVQSVYGDVKEIAFFELHDSRKGTVTMGDFLKNSGSFPGYVDLFWGRVVLLTSTGNEFQSLVRRKLREASTAQALDKNKAKGPAKYELKLGVKMYPPRGGCGDYPADENGSVIEHVILFN